MPTKADFTLMYPCHDGWDSQGFHDGGAIDIGWLSRYSSDGRTDIYASADGIVDFEGWYEQKYGGKTYRTICVIIRHHSLLKDKDIITIYWHLSQSIVNKGDIVKRGQVIGKKGNTGNSGGVHLHFQCLELEKGQALPSNYNGGGWQKYTFYPVDYLRVYPNTVFESRGNYNILPYEPAEKTDIKSEIKTLLVRLVELIGEL